EAVRIPHVQRDPHESRCPLLASENDPSHGIVGSYDLAKDHEEELCRRNRTAQPHLRHLERDQAPRRVERENAAEKNGACPDALVEQEPHRQKRYGRGRKREPSRHGAPRSAREGGSTPRMYSCGACSERAVVSM